jgi:RNA polymerase sigma-70 factor (ECF subfamily)
MDTSEHSDAGLVERFREGDDDAFTVLYERHKHGLLAYCRSLLGSAEAAEDVVQNAFLRAFEGMGGLRQPALFRSWLFTIARNEAYMLLRRPAMEQVKSGEVWAEESPADAAGRVDEEDLVRSLIARLKPEYREALVLVTYEGLRYAEIAEITKSSVSAVESRIFKARRALARALAPYMSERRSA